MRATSVITGAVLTLALPGCTAESVESDNVFTDGIYADLRAVASDTGTRATATLRVGGGASNTYVMLGANDALTVSADGQTEEMTEQGSGNVYRYSADLTASAGGVDVVFTFERTLDEGAPDSRCTLPAAATISEPAEDATLSRSEDDLVITWEAGDPDDTLRLAVEGTCFSDFSETLDDDPGTYTIPAGTLQSAGDPPEACSATVRLTRERLGDLDVGYGEGGRVLCSQVREVSLRLDP